MSIPSVNGGASAQQLLALQQQIAESFDRNSSEVDGQQQALDPSLLAQGGDAAVEEIRKKMYSGVADPAKALQLAQETAAEFALAQQFALQLQAPDVPTDATQLAGDAGLGDRMASSAQQAPIDMFAIMALVLKLESNLRKSESAASVAEAQLGAQLKDSAADEIVKAAQDRLVGACVSGAMQIAGGAFSMGAGAYSLSSMSSATAAADAVEENLPSNQLAEEELPSDLGLEPSMDSPSDSGTTPAENIEAATQDIEMDDLSASHGTTNEPTASEASDARIEDADLQAADDRYMQMTSARQTAFGNAFKKADAIDKLAQGSGSMLQGVGGIVSGAQEDKAAHHDAQGKKDEAQAELVAGQRDSTKAVIDAIRDTTRQLMTAFDAEAQSVDQSNRRAVA